MSHSRRSPAFASVPALAAVMLGFLFLAVSWSSAARAEALLLVDVESGKVLKGENATHPWYPASVTKLMTTYVTLKAVRDQRITLQTLITVSAAASSQSPSKMGFKPGTQLTVDNALKMMLVHSANDMAVVLAEGVGGTIEKFCAEMNATAQRLGMTQTNYVNPNGLPDEGQVTSARDLAMLARALLKDFPEYDSYWHIASIKYGKRVYRNTNRMIDAYPGTDGMKTGFICASGYNLVATATRDNKRLIAVVLGASSSNARAQKAAQMFEAGFSQSPLSWLMPAPGTLDSLVPFDALPPNLRDDICGKNRPHQAEDGEAENADEGQNAFSLSSIGGGAPRNVSLLTSGLAAGVPPVEVYTGAKPGGPVADLDPPKKKKPKQAALQNANPPKRNGGKPTPGTDKGEKPDAGRKSKPTVAAVKPKPANPGPQ